MRAEGSGSDSTFGPCGLCGGDLVKNPHPDAGKPEVLTEVGYVWVCPPCITKAMSGWARRAHAAEAIVRRVADQYGGRFTVGAHVYMPAEVWNDVRDMVENSQSEARGQSTPPSVGNGPDTDS